MAEKYQQRHEISTTTATIDEIAVFLSGSGNCQPSCRLNTCDYAAILSSNSPSISSSFAAIC